MLSVRTRQVRAGKGGRGPSALQGAVRARLPRSPVEADVRRGYFGGVRNEDGGNPLLYVTVHRREGRWGDPSDRAGSVRVDPGSSSALRIPDPAPLWRAVLHERDAGSR